MKNKKEIIEAAKKLAECYYQENSISLQPYCGLPGKSGIVKDAEITSRWEVLLESIGVK